jgi:spore coat polysaccharide biosynthesis protein SpsF (cytidylyltransferase family)
MDATVVLQARMGSSRLPGKAMLPLDGDPTLVREIRRIGTASSFDREDVVVATTNCPCDDVIDWTANRVGARVYRGPETDVLGRIHAAIEASGADVVVRATGDNPLVDPRLIDELVRTIRTADVDYVSNKVEGTFPTGLGASAFTSRAISRAAETVEDDIYREHMGKYFRDNLNRITWTNVTAREVFDDTLLDEVPDLPNLRLTMDEPADYRLLSRVFDEVPYDDVLDTETAIRYIVAHDLQAINADVTQAIS